MKKKKLDKKIVRKIILIEKKKNEQIKVKYAIKNNCILSYEHI